MKLTVNWCLVRRKKVELLLPARVSKVGYKFFSWLSRDSSTYLKGRVKKKWMNYLLLLIDLSITKDEIDNSLWPLLDFFSIHSKRLTHALLYNTRYFLGPKKKSIKTTCGLKLALKSPNQSFAFKNSFLAEYFNFGYFHHFRAKIETNFYFFWKKNTVLVQCDHQKIAKKTRGKSRSGIWVHLTFLE